MVSTEEARSVLDGVAHYANDELDQYHAACALESFGVAVSVHADDIDSIHYGYESLLVRAAKIAGGKVSITNVRIVEGEGDLEDGHEDLLEFERNSKLVSMTAEHYAEDYYNHEAACEAIATTAHEDDPRSWHLVDFERKANIGYDSILVLATPEQTDALHAHLGLTFPTRGR